MGAGRSTTMYDDVEMPYPPTFDDDYATRPAAEAAEMRIGRDMTFTDQGRAARRSDEDELAMGPSALHQGLPALHRPVDDNVGRLLDCSTPTISPTTRS